MFQNNSDKVLQMNYLAQIGGHLWDDCLQSFTFFPLTRAFITTATLSMFPETAASYC